MTSPTGDPTNRPRARPDGRYAGGYADAFAVASPGGTVAVRGLALCTLAVVAVAVVGGHGDGTRSASPRPIDLIASALPVVLVGLLALVDHHRRRSWIVLATALGLMTGSLVWAGSLDPLAAARPSDAIRIGGTVALALALALVTRNIDPSSLRSDRLDGSILVFGASAGAAMLWNGSTAGFSGDGQAAGIAVAGAAVALVLAAVVASTVSAMRYRPSPAVMMMAVATGLYLSADVTHLRSVLETDASALAGTTAVPGIIDLRLVAGMLIATAAWIPRSTRRAHGERLSQLRVIPVVFSLVALVILATSIVHTVNIAASVLALTALAAVILRTAITVHELHTGSESFRLARTDELTSLINRRGCLEGLDRLIEVAPGNLAVMIIDLNGFKEVNDSLGHHAGDELLRLVADRFRPVIGDAGLLARLGGDEFGVVIMVPDEQAALDGAVMLQRSLDDAFLVDGLSVRVGAAIGVAMYPTHSRTRSGVLRSADVAMYDAKSRRTAVEMYHPASDYQTREKLQLLEDLRQAIDHRGLSLYYQPKVGLRDGKITSSEALVRWEHPTRGLLLPDEFVPLAERAGLVPGLTRAVLAQAISFHAERCPHVGVSVNISHRDVVDDRLADYIADLLEIYGYPAGKLTLEITETELAHDPVRAARSIANLRAAGMRISIDDFGVGYSSMARLLDLEVDEVKIDKSFVFAISDDPRAIAIIRSTVELAAALGLAVVAEGIESADVLTQVMRAGVDVGQGYVITRPLTGMDYLEFLGARTKGIAPAPTRPPALPTRATHGPLPD